MSDMREAFEAFYKKENGFHQDCTMEMIYEIGADKDEVDELFKYWQAATAQSVQDAERKSGTNEH